MLAVEPHANMRAELEKKECRGVTVLEGNAASMPIEEGWGDALIAAQVSAVLLLIPMWCWTADLNLR